MKRKITKFLQIILEIVGIRTSTGRNVRRTFSKVVSTSLLVIGASLMTVYVIQNKDSFQDLSIGSLYIVGSYGIVFSYFIFLANSKDTTKLIMILDDDFFTYPDEAKLALDYKRILKEKNIVLYSIFLFCYVFFLVLMTYIMCLVCYLLYETRIMPMLMWMPLDSILATYLIQ